MTVIFNIIDYTLSHIRMKNLKAVPFFKKNQKKSIVCEISTRGILQKQTIPLSLKMDIHTCESLR